MVDSVYQSKGRGTRTSKTVTWKVLELWGNYRDSQGDQGLFKGWEQGEGCEYR